MSENLIALDLFAGCGGLSLGFEQAGVEIAVANEIWDPAVKTYQYNNPRTKMIHGDITNYQIQNEITEISKKENVNIIIGGPPCQAFSTAGYRNCLDKRFNLFKEYIKIVKNIQPKIIVMENVKGILNAKTFRNNLNKEELKVAAFLMNEIFRFKQLNKSKAQRDLTNDEIIEWNILKSRNRENKKKLNAFKEPVINEILRNFKEVGYKVNYEILDAQNYDIAQHRERVIFIGHKNGFKDDIFPKKSSVIIPCKSVLEDLEKIRENELPNHNFTKHKPQFVERLKKVKQGTSLTKYREGFFRLDPNKPSPTVKENHGSVFIHYEQNRCVTPRELARLQSFSDNFIFKGSKGHVLKQIGNSVPPKLANAIANQLIKLQ